MSLTTSTGTALVPVAEIETRTYGFMIKRTRDSIGTCSIDIHVMAREPGKAYPMNCDTRGESEYRDDTPKHARGLNYGDLMIRVWRSDKPESDTGQYRVYGANVCYGCVYHADSARIKSMARTMAKIDKALEKAKASEPGDVLMALAKAIGATFYVELRGAKSQASRVSWYSDESWSWWTLADGRDALRRAVDDFRTKPDSEWAR